MTRVRARPDVSLQEPRRKSRSAFWGLVTLALVGITLLGSVAIPARQSWLIMQLLSKTTKVHAPAQLLVEELQTGLARELALLQGYVLSGDDAQLRRYRMTVDDDERRAAALERLATRFDTTAARRARVLRSRIGEWHRFNDAPIAQRWSRDELAAALEAGQARYDSSLSEIAALSSFLAAAAVARDHRVRALERTSILANSVLVITAVVMSGVLIAALRERRLSASLHRRLKEESALRQLARRLGAAVTREEALRCVAEGALATTRASGASVEWRISRKRVIALVAAVGEATPASCTRAPYSGSLT